MSQQPQLNKRLSSLDSTFLYFERKEAPLHIGSFHLFEGEIDFDAFVANMVARLPLLPRYTQKVVMAPFDLGHPTWEQDPNFSIANHIFKVQLDKPGTIEQFHDLSERIMPPMLDRNKPLWEIFLVYGFADGSSGMICKVHHAMIDGMSGIDLLKIIFDISPEPKPLPKIEARVTPAEPPANPNEQIVEAMLSTAEEGVKSWFNFQRGVLNLAETFLKGDTNKMLQNLTNLSPMASSFAQPFSFNRPPTGKQKLTWAEYFFADVRAIRSRLGGTVNDVILTALSGAIGRYLESTGQSIAGRTLRIMVPVSMRPEDQKGALGNLVSILPVEIPFDLRDPSQRLGFVGQKTGALKESRVADTLNLFTSLLGVVPPSIQAVIGSLAYLPLPPFNIVATNVPGPQIPLYSMGKRQTHYFPYVPVAYSVGMTIAIVSYDQKIFIGVTTDGEYEKNPYILKNFLDEEFRQLLALAGVESVSKKAIQQTVSETRIKNRTATAESNGKAKDEKAAMGATIEQMVAVAEKLTEPTKPLENEAKQVLAEGQSQAIPQAELKPETPAKKPRPATKTSRNTAAKKAAPKVNANGSSNGAKSPETEPVTGATPEFNRAATNTGKEETDTPKNGAAPAAESDNKKAEPKEEAVVAANRNGRAPAESTAS
jgi:diacylglycerol O-acyltransferase / wax synthase